MTRPERSKCLRRRAGGVAKMQSRADGNLVCRVALTVDSLDQQFDGRLAHQLGVAYQAGHFSTQDPLIAGRPAGDKRQVTRALHSVLLGHPEGATGQFGIEANHRARSRPEREEL